MAFWLDRRAQLEPGAAAITFRQNTWSYSAFRERIARLVAVLKDNGVSIGDRVGTLSNNNPDILTTMFAASAIGAVLVPLNIRLSPGELGFIVNNAEISVIIADAAGIAWAGPERERWGNPVCISIDGEAADWVSLPHALASARADTSVYQGADSDLAAIVYTSGTTGAPKGAMLTNGNLWANDTNWLLAADIARTDIAIIAAPLFHVGGLFVLTTTTLLAGGSLVLMPGFDPDAIFEAIEKYRGTTMFGVPTMMLSLSRHPRFDTADMTSVRLYVAGGAPVPEPLLQRYAARGIPVSQCYGLSEATAATVFLETKNGLTKLGSAGRVGMMAELRLVNPDGSVVVEPNIMGEICIRGGNVSPGYWRNPEATRATIDDEGWLKTGDIGTVDADGFLTVCDRLKDMIISGGENVYPAEVESHLFEHESIANIAVIGRRDDHWGERVVAVAVLHDGHRLDLESLQRFCTGRLARYKIPRELHLVTKLPLNGSGKVVKTALRAQLEELPLMV